jgi:hypothetical protein
VSLERPAIDGEPLSELHAPGRAQAPKALSSFRMPCEIGRRRRWSGQYLAHEMIGLRGRAAAPQPDATPPGLARRKI